MKRASVIIAAAVMLSLTACDKKNDRESSSSEAAPAVTEEVGGTEEISTGAAEKTDEAVTTTAEEATEAVTTAVFGEDFQLPENDPQFEQQLDDEVIAAAQALFEKACETEWSFTVGSPYQLDTSEYVTNEYDWQFYLITDEGINSLDDVMADYHAVFSEDYDDNLDELYVERDGRVYCLNGARGSDIFYEGSEVTEITGRDDGEIRFKVISSYNGASFGGEAYTQEDEFVIVREDDGKWRVVEFRLPY